MKTHLHLLQSIAVTAGFLGAAMTINADTSIDSKLHKIVPKGKSQAYSQIPWETDLLRARALSKKTGKPMFLWVMDGNPLGCT